MDSKKFIYGNAALINFEIEGDKIPDAITHVTNIYYLYLYCLQNGLEEICLEERGYNLLFQNCRNLGSLKRLFDLEKVIEGLRIKYRGEIIKSLAKLEINESSKKFIFKINKKYEFLFIQSGKDSFFYDLDLEHLSLIKGEKKKRLFLLLWLYRNSSWIKIQEKDIKKILNINSKKELNRFLKINLNSFCIKEFRFKEKNGKYYERYYTFTQNKGINGGYYHISMKYIPIT